MGYSFARFFGCHFSSARTISIEVGMQNSGLAIVLAKQAFPDANFGTRGRRDFSANAFFAR